MRKLFFAGLLCMPFFASAQILKKDFFAGGAASFNSTKHTGEDNAANAFTFSPKGGYFFADKLAAGIKGDLGFYSKDDDSYFYFSAGPLARYYFLNPGKQTNIFLEGSYLFGSEKYKGFDAESNSTWGLSAGPAIFISKNIALETAINWSSLKIKNEIGRYNSWGISFGLQVHFLHK